MQKDNEKNKRKFNSPKIKYMQIIIIMMLNGCAVYEPEIIYPVTNIRDFYNQCKSSENIYTDNQNTISYADRYYCLGYVQAISENTIYWRKKNSDINPKCQTTVKDFYHNFVRDVEQGKFNNEKSISNVFRYISYELCPKIKSNRTQYISSENI